MTNYTGWGNPKLSVDKNLYNEQILYDVLCDNQPERISYAYDREETPIEKKLRSYFQFDQGWSFFPAVDIIYFGEYRGENGGLEPGPQTCGCCFVPGTKVRMKNGTHKNIEDINVLDSVLTAEGNTGLVMQVMTRNVDEDIYNVKLYGHYGIKATKEHPILTKRGYVEICNLQENDLVLIPKYIPNSITEIDPELLVENHRRVLNYSKTEYKILQHQIGFTKSTRRVKSETQYPLPDKIKLDYGFGKILGLFLAEGSTDRSRANFSFSIDEEDTLAQEVIEYFQKNYNVTPNISKKIKTNNLGVRVSGRDWAYLFEVLCGYLSSGKQLHESILCGPKEFLQGIVDGWLSGDGYERRNRLQGTTVSEILAHQMYDILTYLGHMPTIRYSDPKISHTVKSRQRRWDIEFNTNNVPSAGLKPSQDSSFVYRKVKKITREKYNGYVFNFEVLGDNSYTANGIGVHNCVGYSHALALASKIAHESYVDGDGEELMGDGELGCPFVGYGYGCSRVKVGGVNWRSDGSLGQWMIKASQEYGFVTCAEAGVNKPDPSSSVTRQYGGSRSYLDKYQSIALKRDLVLSRVVKSYDDLWQNIVVEKAPCQISSNWGFKFSHTKDGMAIYTRSGSWAHQMSIQAAFEFKGDRYAYISNQWGRNSHKNPGLDLPKGGFIITADLFDRWAKDAHCASINEVKTEKMTMPVFQI